jgi:hypothetical protein
MPTRSAASGCEHRCTLQGSSGYPLAAIWPGSADVARVTVASDVTVKEKKLSTPSKLPAAELLDDAVAPIAAVVATYPPVVLVQQSVAIRGASGGQEVLIPLNLRSSVVR